MVTPVLAFTTTESINMSYNYSSSTPSNDRYGVYIRLNVNGTVSINLTKFNESTADSCILYGNDTEQIESSYFDGNVCSLVGNHSNGNYYLMTGKNGEWISYYRTDYSYPISSSGGAFDVLNCSIRIQGGDWSNPCGENQLFDLEHISVTYSSTEPEEPMSGYALLLSDVGTGLGGFIGVITEPVSSFVLRLGIILIIIGVIASVIYSLVSWMRV